MPRTNVPPPKLFGPLRLACLPCRGPPPIFGAKYTRGVIGFPWVFGPMQYLPWGGACGLAESGLRQHHEGGHFLCAVFGPRLWFDFVLQAHTDLFSFRSSCLISDFSRHPFSVKAIAFVAFISIPTLVPPSHSLNGGGFAHLTPTTPQAGPCGEDWVNPVLSRELRVCGDPSALAPVSDIVASLFPPKGALVAFLWHDLTAGGLAT